MNKESGNELAVFWVSLIRDAILLYGRQWISDDDINAVVTVLKTDGLTTGSKVAEFERSFAATVV